MSKILKIILATTISLVIVISTSYFYGRPYADNIGYESKYYRLDLINERVYTFFSLSAFSRANKYVSLAGERSNEYRNIKDKQARERALISFFGNCKKARILISKVQNEEDRNELNGKLAEIIIDLLYIERSGNPDEDIDSTIVDNLSGELKKIFDDLPEIIKTEIREKKKDKIKTNGEIIGESSSEDNEAAAVNEEFDTDEGHGTKYFPIRNISREEIHSLISSDYQGDYILKTVNVLSEKGYFCANIAIPDNFGALYLIRNSESGYVVDFVETDYDFSNISKPGSITESEWQWLLYNANLENEKTINFY